jgi:hypothetical protein
MRTLSLLALLLCPQDTESAATSKATEAALPPGALRFLQKDTVEQSAALLKALYKDFTLKNIEVLIWPGDYSGGKGAALRRQTDGLLEKAGYVCKESINDQKIEGREGFVCSAVKPDRRVFGMWISSAEAAMLIWGEDASGSGGGEAVFENVIYATPKGWTVAAAASGVTLTPPDLLPDEKLFVLILPGREFKGDLKESAQALWTEACGGFQVDGGKLTHAVDVYQSLKGWSYFRYTSEVRPATGRLLLSVTFIRVGDRLERAAVLTNYVSAPYFESPIHNPKYERVIDWFIFGLKFRNHVEPKLAEGRLTGEGIVGVWMGVSMAFVARTGNLEWNGTTAAFYSNGQVFYNTKLQTFLFEGVNPILAREVTPRWWGSWTFDQGSGTMKMLYGDIAMELKGEALVLTTSKTPHKFVRLAPVDGARLEGTYAFTEHNGKIPKITFSGDGRFTDDGALNVLEHCLYKLYATTRKPGEGTYEVKNYTILFHYADGREFTAAFLGLTYTKGDRTPAALTLGFNDDTLKRQ